MFPPRVLIELIEAHESAGGTKVELLRKVAGGHHMVAELLHKEETRASIEAMSRSVYLRFITHVIEQSMTGRPRKRLHDVATLESAASLIKRSKKIVVLTGAGISTSCGIPDFRSASGVYSMLGGYQLSDPQDLFAIQYFRRNVKPFYDFARKLWPGTHKPAPTHLFIRELEKRGSLLRNYTQNIDTLENVAGVKNVVQCHGSFATATCTRCKYKCPGDDIRECILGGVAPRCPRCLKTPPPPLVDTSGNNTLHNPFGFSLMGQDNLPTVDPVFDKGCMKPDIVFFGESLPSHFFDTIEQDIKECDLLLVMGTSLKVAPVSRVIEMIDDNVPQILINREVVARPHEFDVELLGNCDAVNIGLARQLGWELGTSTNVPQESKKSEKPGCQHRILFEGAVEDECIETPDDDLSTTSDDDDDIVEPECKRTVQHEAVSPSKKPKIIE